MTAIGAVPAGGFPQPSAADIEAMTPIDVAAWSADVYRWLVGPYTGATPVALLQWRALALVAYAARAAGVDPAASAAIQTGNSSARTGNEPHSPAGVVATNRTLGAQGAQGQAGLVDPRDPDPATGAAPGSVGDPAYTSPTPVAGERVEPQDQFGPGAPGEGQQPVPESPAQP